MESSHLAASTWERLACDELSPVEEKAAHQHIESCDDCGMTWAALREVRSAAETFDPYFQAPASNVVRFGRFGIPRPFIALAAAAVLALAVGLPLVQQGGQDPEPAPALDRSASSALPEPTSPAEGASGDVTGFQWQGPPAADRYVVELLDGDGTLLWRSERLSDRRVPWPSEVEKAPGAYYWRVIAFDTGQSSSSDLVRFALTE